LEWLPSWVKGIEGDMGAVSPFQAHGCCEDGSDATEQ
jgi:hypothetical protein